MNLKTTTTIAALLSMSILLAACSAPPVADTTSYRVTGHYSSIGPVGQAKAYVYADKTVIELDGPATAARTTDRNGIDYPNTIEGRFVRLDGIVPEVRVQVGGRARYLTLDPAAKVYSARGIAMTDMTLKVAEKDQISVGTTYVYKAKRNYRNGTYSQDEAGARLALAVEIADEEPGAFPGTLSKIRSVESPIKCRDTKNQPGSKSLMGVTWFCEQDITYEITSRHNPLPVRPGRVATN